ncbi:hypothetical protein [Streptomyces sp. WAC06614]|uniref:hypothetical protein n=1 Tax=Streptomyces sp. WAC06614 TaxID=2487416 RepID=UPI000F98A08B|nr:hypothetical protein [Streptomyces sp. WAC06614]RSS75533.1 hypothetical protein EF918_24085 [Streptomyces sp. WAC06614]
MSDIPDVFDGHVLGLFAARIEAQFGLAMPELTQAVHAAPQAHPGATQAVHWYGLLSQAQQVLERAEDTLVAALETAVGDQLDDPVMELAHRVNHAVAARDGRAITLRFLLQAPAETARIQQRFGPRVTTTLPTPVPAQPARIRSGTR